MESVTFEEVGMERTLDAAKKRTESRVVEVVVNIMDNMSRKDMWT